MLVDRFRRLVPALVLLLGSAGCTGPSCTEPPCAPEEPPPRGRVLLVAVDGATHKLIDPLIEQGELPTLRALAEAGVRGQLLTEGPILSPRIWTSVATGRRPSTHGIADWVRRDEEGALHLYESTDRRVPAIWNVVSDAGLEVGVVNWLQTHPPERVRGVLVSDQAIAGTYEARIPMASARAERMFPRADPSVEFESSGVVVASPPEWAPRAAALRDVDPPLTDVSNPFTGDRWKGSAGIDGYLHSRYVNDQHVARIALEIDSERSPDLLMVYLPGIDRISHFLWSGIEAPQHVDGEDARRLALVAPDHRAALLDYYRFVDGLLARLVERYGPEDLVLVLSDHGFEPVETMPGGHESDSARAGILFARGPGLDAGAEVGGVSMLDVAPTVLAFLGLPAARDWPGRVVFGMPEQEPVATYDDLEIEREASGGVPSEEALEELRALGYVEER